MAASISSSFDILLDQTINGSSVVITNTGRTFRLVGVSVTGAAGAGVVVKKNDTNGTVVAGPGPAVNAAMVNGYQISVAAAATATFAATDNIYIEEEQNAAVTRVVLHCVAGDAQAMTVT